MRLTRLTPKGHAPTLDERALPRWRRTLRGESRMPGQRWVLRCRLIVRLIALLCLFAGQAVAVAKPFVLVYADYKPFSYVSEGGVKGLEIEILTEVLEKRLKLSIEHRILPWSRAQQYVRDGVADAFVATTNAERGGYAMRGKEVVTYWDVSLYVRQGDARFAKVRTLEDAKPFEFGAVMGNGWVKSMFPDARIQFVDREELLPRMLLAGRFDLIPENPLVMAQLLAGDPAVGHVAEIPMPQVHQAMYLHVYPRSDLAAWLPRIDEVLAAMRADGSLQRIEARYRDHQ